VVGEQNIRRRLILKALRLLIMGQNRIALGQDRSVFVGSGA
jgi:hypothetical protein